MTKALGCRIRSGSGFFRVDQRNSLTDLRVTLRGAIPPFPSSEKLRRSTWRQFRTIAVDVLMQSLEQRAQRCVLAGGGLLPQSFLP